MILSICNLPDSLKVIRIINIVITIIRISVPIILMVSVMISLLKAVTNAELNKITKPMINKVIAAILIFLIPTFVRVIAYISGNNEEYTTCINNATSEGIENAFITNANIYIDKAYESLDRNDYNTAMGYANNINDDNISIDLQNKINELDVYFNLEDRLNRLDKNFDLTEYKAISNDINNIENEDLRNKLLNRYNDIKHYTKTDVVTESNSVRYHINGYNNLKFYLYNQCEGGWRNIKIGSGTYCDGGCGLTTQTVLISAYNPDVRPTDAVRFGDDYHHDTVIEKQTNNSYDCTKYDLGKITNEHIISAMEEGSVVSVKVWGKSKGGKSSFTGSQHYMSLIDYYEGEIFIGNAYNLNYKYGSWGWYKAEEVLTSVQSTVICKPLK